MNDETKNRIGVFRFSLIAPVINKTFTQASVKEYLEEVCTRKYDAPGNLKGVYSPETLKDWIYRFRREGLDGLVPKGRKDKGTLRALSPNLREQILEMKMSNPALSAKAIYSSMLASGAISFKDVSLCTIQRFISNNSQLLRTAPAIVDFARTMDWTGWKYVDASLDNIKLPAKLTRLYLVQTNPVADAGSIYFDDLTFTSSGYPAVDISKIPKNTELIDEASKAVSFKKATGDSFRFGVLGKSRAHANEIEKSLGASFASKINKYLDVGAVVGNGSHESITGLIKKKPVIATHDIDLKSTKAADYKYSVTDHKNSRFFKLDVRDKSLRRSDSAQWHQFLRDLKSFKGKNVFIFMQNSPEGFSDKLEMSFFKETISDYRLDTLRNVWVFYQGAKNDSFLEKGVKYISTAGYEVAGVEAGKTDAAQYALVTVKGSIVTYVYKPIK